MQAPSVPRPGKLRAFFALTLCSDSLRRVCHLGDQVVNQISAPRFLRRTPRESMHLTLKFLGDILETDSGAFANLLPSITPVQLPAADLGPLMAFPSMRSARVVALRLLDDSGEITRLARTLEQGASGLGVAPESRAFVPHITIARLREPMDLREALPLVSFEVSQLRFDAIRLYRAELLLGGSRYHVIAERAAT